jgi:hypothetical protein
VILFCSTSPQNFRKLKDRFFSKLFASLEKKTMLCLIRKANERIVRKFASSDGERFSAHPLNVDDLVSSRAIVYANRETCFQLKLIPGDYILIEIENETNENDDDSERDESSMQSKSIVAQIFVEDGFWTIALSDKQDALPEFFISTSVSKRFNFELESNVNFFLCLFESDFLDTIIFITLTLTRISHSIL